eukprot:751072-Hanusia_phi.AAC.3
MSNESTASFDRREGLEPQRLYVQPRLSELLRSCDPDQPSSCSQRDECQYMARCATIPALVCNGLIAGVAQRSELRIALSLQTHQLLYMATYTRQTNYIITRPLVNLACSARSVPFTPSSAQTFLALFSSAPSQT